MTASHVVQVALVIEMDNGEMHKLVVSHPKPTGGNPRFIRQQMVNALEAFDERIDDLSSLYGRQIEAVR